MDIEKNINKFFDLLDNFNEIGVGFVKNGDFKNAIKTYETKNAFIRLGYEYNIICIENATAMTKRNNELIRTLEFMFGVSERS